jgi:hypothetical protein
MDGFLAEFTGGFVEVDPVEQRLQLALVHLHPRVVAVENRHIRVPSRKRTLMAWRCLL